MKELKIKKIRPQFTTVITTLDTYEEDLYENGVLVAPKGCLKLYQKVVAVGTTVRGVNEGDLVLLNLQNYIKRKYKENSLKEDMSAMEDEIVFDFPKIMLDGKIYGKFQDRDIDGVIEDFEEIEITENVNPLLN